MMKKRWIPLVTALLAIAMLLTPLVKLQVHSQIAPETAAQFPGTISLGSVLLRGASALPVDAVPALALAHFGQGYLLAGLILLALSAGAALVKKRGALIVSAGGTLVSALLLSVFALQVSNLGNSLLFTLLFDVQAWVWLPLVLAIVQLICLVVFIIQEKDGFDLPDKTWRIAGGVLALAAAACLLLPVHVVNVPETITAAPADAAAMSRSLSLLDEALGREANLQTIAAREGVFADVLTGDLAALEPFSADATNIKGVFVIKTVTTAPNVMLLSGAILLALALILSLIPPVDRWFAVCCEVLALVLVCASVLGIMTIGGEDMFASATRQLSRLGVGTVTFAPMLMVLLTLCSALCGMMSIRAANEPYFVNPIPEKQRLRVIAIVLTVVSLGLMLAPGVSFSFTKPGMNKVQSTVPLAGAQAMVFSTPEDILSPKSTQGKALYTETASKTGNLTDASVAEIMSGLTRIYGIATWVCVAVTVAALVMVLLRRSKKATIALLLSAAVLRALTWLIVSLQMPKVIGSAAGTAYLFASLPVLVFAAFFAWFADHDELPKKYKLFLMMLPFLVAVFLFSYLPLYGWSYAFFNYKFGKPMSEQEFVGLKWFTELVTNQGHRDNIVRVMKNTFGMSGLGLLTSWLPMAFAIFLNEIGNSKFKKFVQIFTTLPNFISWALVFSFAMAMFAMDTGIFSKFMLGIGAIDQPVAWLNSSEHIWLKMWAWGTWKGLGWGAIMYLAAISGIDQELYEAAQVDGAGRWAKIRYITLPGLLPTFFVLLMLSISNILNNGMDQYLAFQNSMNKSTIEVLDLYVYNITIASGGTTLYSFATAIGILKTLVSVTLLFSANFASKKLRGESIM
ncbi:MAG: ABC transporter permease [Aristaeellaceae bacterium]